MHRQVDAQSSIPIRRQLTEPREHVIEGGGAPRNQALPGIRELVGVLGINPNTREHAIEDLKRSGYRPLFPLTVRRARPSRGCPQAPGATRETLRGEKLPSTCRGGPAG
jgi:DNA-binding transcriptional MocR family regulator